MVFNYSISWFICWFLRLINSLSPSAFLYYCSVSAVKSSFTLLLAINPSSFIILLRAICEAPLSMFFAFQIMSRIWRSIAPAESSFSVILSFSPLTIIDCIIRIFHGSMTLWEKSFQTDFAFIPFIVSIINDCLVDRIVLQLNSELPFLGFLVVDHESAMSRRSILNVTIKYEMSIHVLEFSFAVYSTIFYVALVYNLVLEWCEFASSVGVDVKFPKIDEFSRHYVSSFAFSNCILPIPFVVLILSNTFFELLILKKLTFTWIIIDILCECSS